jgi:hypothetical protein
MPSNQTRKRQGKGSKTNVDSSIVAAHHSAARGDVLFDRADLIRKKISWLFTQSPPKNFSSMIYWIQESYVNNVTLSSSVPTESNLSFQLGLLPGASKLASIFDQYAIYSVFVRAMLAPTSSASLSSNGRITTAIDYDNTTALGSEAAVMEYASSITSELVGGKDYERYIKPCVITTVTSGTAIERLWINCSNTSVPHFGYRSFFNANPTAAAAVDQIVTYVVAFRNTI